MATRFITRNPLAATTYTGEHASIGVDSDDMRLYVNSDGTKRPINFANVKTITSATTLTAADSGAFIVLNSATGFVTTLPALAEGLEFTFLVRTAPTSGSHTVVTASSANVMLGQILTIDVNSATDADFEASGGDTFSFVVNKATKGDRAHFICDGTNWYVTSAATVFDGHTITTAS